MKLVKDLPLGALIRVSAATCDLEHHYSTIVGYLVPNSYVSSLLSLAHDATYTFPHILQHDIGSYKLITVYPDTTLGEIKPPTNFEDYINGTPIAILEYIKSQPEPELGPQMVADRPGVLGPNPFQYMDRTHAWGEVTVRTVGSVSQRYAAAPQAPTPPPEAPPERRAGYVEAVNRGPGDWGYTSQQQLMDAQIRLSRLVPNNPSWINLEEVERRVMAQMQIPRHGR